MNDNKAFERTVAEAFDGEGRGRPVPDAIHDELLTNAGRTRQLPGPLASIKEPPLRLAGRTTVGSPTLRGAGVLAAALLLAVLLAAAAIAGQRLLSTDTDAAVDVDHVVAADGSGTHSTIAAAVQDALAGERILVREGTYAESVTISKDITLFGERRDGVIIEFGAGCTFEAESSDQEQTCPPEVGQLDGAGTLPSGPYALHLTDADASITDLTIRHRSRGYGLYVDGGAPTITDVVFADNTFANLNGAAWVMLRGGTAATVSDSDFGASTLEIVESSPVTIERNTIGGLLSNAPPDEASGAPAVLRNNLVSGTISADGLHRIEGNVIDLADDPGDQAGILIRSGAGWSVRGNTVRNSTNPTGAIDIGDQAGDGMVVGNVLEGNIVGIGVSPSDGRPRLGIEGNTITDGQIGIRSTGGGLVLIDNTVERMTQRGIEIGDYALLSMNVVCDNGTDLFILDGASADIDGSNELCVVRYERDQ